MSYKIPHAVSYEVLHKICPTERSTAIHEQWEKELGISDLTTNDIVLYVRRMEAEGTPVIGALEYSTIIEAAFEKEESRQERQQFKENVSFVTHHYKNEAKDAVGSFFSSCKKWWDK
jgi:hypothetical protein